MNFLKRKEKGIFLLIDLRSTLSENSKRLKLATGSENMIKVLTQQHSDRGIIHIKDLNTDDIDNIEHLEIIFPTLPSKIKKHLYENKWYITTWNEIKEFLI